MAANKQTNAKPAARKPPRVPTASNGIDINFCKNPICSNFGIPIEPKAERGRNAQNRYAVVANGAKMPAGKCNNCGRWLDLGLEVRGSLRAPFPIQGLAGNVLLAPVLADRCKIP